MKLSNDPARSSMVGVPLAGTLGWGVGNLAFK